MTRPWRSQARPQQIPPDTDWRVFCLLAGRGFGKSWASSNWLAEQAASRSNSAWAMISPTWRDARVVGFEGAAGLLHALHADELESYDVTDLRIRLKNGSRIFGYSADHPERLHCGVFDGAVVDELDRFPSGGREVWDALDAVVVGGGQIFVATSQAHDDMPGPIVRELLVADEHFADPKPVIVRLGSTFDNANNLSKTALAELRKRYGSKAPRSCPPVGYIS